MILSVVIPAYNEAPRLPATIKVLRGALEQAGIAPHEIIVADDGSTDRTAAAAEAAGARVVAAGVRNIGAARNAGARSARGRYLLFLDADTHVTAAALRSMMAAFAAGAAGGGAPLEWDEPVNLFGRLSIGFWNRFSRLARLPAGGFLFARRDFFMEAGGFDERYYVSEEIWLGRALSRRGRLVIIPDRVRTSARKLTDHPPSELLRLLARLAMRPLGTLRDRGRLSFWYVRRDKR